MTRSMNADVRSSSTGRQPSTAFCVNHGSNALRMRVCSGGSISMKPSGTGYVTGIVTPVYDFRRPCGS